jgi:hypothetical protein
VIKVKAEELRQRLEASKTKKTPKKQEVLGGRQRIGSSNSAGIHRDGE